MGLKKVTKSVSKGFKSVTKAVISTPVKQIVKEVARVPENVGNIATSVVKEIARVPENVGELLAGGGASVGATVIQQEAEKAKQRFASEEGQATEQGATDLKTRLGVDDRKKIKRLSTVSSK